MEIGIFKEYNQAIDIVKVRLLELYNKYHSCHFLLENDFKAGLVSKEEYDYVKGLCIFTYDEAVSPKYMLSKDEAAFVKQYGDFMGDGELSVDMVNRKLLNKQRTLNDIGDSIRTFYYFENISESKRKEIFVATIEEFYNDKITACEKEIDRLKSALGSNYYASLNYQQLNETLNNLMAEKKNFIDGAMNGSLKDFMALVEKFYGLNQSYYIWYKKRFVKEECEHEIETTDQESKAIESQGLLSDLSSKQKEVMRINEELGEVALLVTSLTSEVISDSFDNNEPKAKSSFFRRKKGTNINNKNDLYEIFVYYLNYPVFNNFLVQFGGRDSENVDFVVAFEDYFVKHYQYLTYVDPKLFKKRLLLGAINYLRASIDSLKQEAQEVNKSLDDKTGSLSNVLSDIKRFETIKKYYTDNRSDILTVDNILKDLGFSDDEIRRIYMDMKEYIDSNFTKEYLDNPSLSMKVGN